MSQKLIRLHYDQQIIDYTRSPENWILHLSGSHALWDKVEKYVQSVADSGAPPGESMHLTWQLPFE